MLKGKWKLLICIALVTCVIFTASNSVFAAINTGYFGDTPVTDVELEEKADNSALLEPIAAFIYFVGSLMERILGKVFQLITGTNMFPWADAILFNAVPFLDVNIFTGAEGSLVSILYDFITGTYYSLLTLASTFFGIAVMFSAIKLAITAIAEDKAKYKKAIVDWILGLVMLWGMHFFISFVLYLNEQLVIVASSIITSEIEESSSAINSLSDNSEYNRQIVDNFLNAAYKWGWTIKEVLGGILWGAGAILAVLGAVVVFIFVPGVKSAVVAGVLAKIGVGALIVGSTLAFGGRIYTNVQIAKWIYDFTEKLEAEKEGRLEKVDKATVYDFFRRTKITVKGENEDFSYCPADVGAELLKSSVFRDKWYKGKSTNTKFLDWADSLDAKDGARLYTEVAFLTDYIEMEDEDGDKSKILGYLFYKAQIAIWDSLPESQKITEGDEKNYDEDLYKLYKIYCNVFEKCVYGSSNDDSVLYNLGQYFKNASWTTDLENGAWAPDSAEFQSVIMYVLLVAYSLVFFISYTKRLFYVIILILMAPVVVVFDFFMKFGK